MKADGTNAHYNAIASALERGRKKGILKEQWKGHYRLTWSGLGIMLQEVLQGMAVEFAGQVASEAEVAMARPDLLSFSDLGKRYLQIRRLLILLSQKPVTKSGRQIHDEELSRDDLEKLDAKYMKRVRRLLKTQKHRKVSRLGGQGPSPYDASPN
jgi:hypothetical protein